MAGVLKWRKLWQKGFLLYRADLSPQLCMCCSLNSTGKQQVYLTNIRAAHMPFLPGYEGLVAQNAGLPCSCNHRFRAMETTRQDIRIGNKIPGFSQCSNKNTSTDCSVRCNHADTDCYSKLLNTTSVPSSRDAWSKRLLKTPAFGVVSALTYNSSGFVGSVSQIRRACLDVWSKRRRYPLWIEKRSLSYAQTYKPVCNIEVDILETPVVRGADTTGMESETSASPSESEDEDFDFRNFPALTSSFYQDYVRPCEMQSKKKRVWQTRRKPFDTNSKLTLESIPEPKGRMYDFGLGDMLSKPPPLEAGARPQGGFDIDISMEEYEGARPVRLSKSGTVPQRMAHGKLPWNTPEADNWSEISEDPENCLLPKVEDEQEFGWDPYEFDESIDLPHRVEMKED